MIYFFNVTVICFLLLVLWKTTLCILRMLIWWQRYHDLNIPVKKKIGSAVLICVSLYFFFCFRAVLKVRKKRTKKGKKKPLRYFWLLSGLKKKKIFFFFPTAVRTLWRRSLLIGKGNGEAEDAVSAGAASRPRGCRDGATDDQRQQRQEVTGTQSPHGSECQV